MLSSSNALKLRKQSGKNSVSLRGQIDCSNLDLFSVHGAQEVISVISARRVVNKLILSHNVLQDDGCIVLFKFLGSPAGRKYAIVEIVLNSNMIGDRGLSAISEYLNGNKQLKRLVLPNNAFTGDVATIKEFASSIANSSLELLSMGSNKLSDEFARIFFPMLHSTHLRELHLSAIGMTSASVPFILEYISSPKRSRLQRLKCNANSLGTQGVRSITRAIMEKNRLLTHVELYSNLDEGGIAGATDWKENEITLKDALTRNVFLQRETEKQALQLLVYSRTLLLHSTSHSETNRALKRCSDSCTFMSLDRPSPPTSVTTSFRDGEFPFSHLPTELQLSILSLLAPILSPSQRHRIFRYASTSTTLPRLLPCLPRLGAPSALCVPDPSSLVFGGQVWSLGGVGVGGGCASGTCMGSTNSVVCHRVQERNKWLDSVGCSTYEAGEEV